MLLPAPQRGFWLELSRHLRSRALQDAFKRKVRAALERRFQRSIERLSFYPVPVLLRALPGSRIEIHGDSLSKAITVQLYLPRDDSQGHPGTVFHAGRDGEGAARTKPLALHPASGYAFPVVPAQRPTDVGGRRRAQFHHSELLRPGPPGGLA